MAINPFTYGNPISDPARFFGRQVEVEQVYTRLLNAEFESSSIVGERRTGKTSLLNYVAHAAIAASHGLDPKRHLFVYSDLQMLDQRATPTRLWSRLLRRIAGRIDDGGIKEGFSQASQQEEIDSYTLDDLFRLTDERGLCFVLLLDEFENVTNNTNFGPDFFYGLRAIAIHHQLALVTASKQELITLCHSDAVRASPFFNIFANINLSTFSEEETRTMIDRLLEGTGVRFTPDEWATLEHITGYHPYFVQVAAHFLFTAHTRQESPQRRKQTLQREFEEEAASTLADYWLHSDDGERIVLTALALLARQGQAGQQRFSLGKLERLYHRSAPTLSRLAKRALVATRDGGYTLFSTAFGDYVIREVTDVMAETRSYEEWLLDNQSVVHRLPRTAREEVGRILPQIKDAYRGFVLDWLSDPQTLVGAANLLRGVFGL